ncbi:MAG: hypothetical protein SH817_12200 [Leptospira sp.]|nr:hypothetical protein [Leptospira sp.]
MYPHEYIPILNEIEKKYKVSEWKSHGFQIWPVIRVGLGFSLDSISKSVIKDSMFQHITNLIRDTINFIWWNVFDFSKNAKPQSSNFVFFTLTEERSTLYKNKWFNNYCDPINDAMSKIGKNSFYLEYSSRGIYKTPRYSKSFFIQLFLNFRSIYTVLFGEKINYDSFPDFNKVEDLLLKKTDIEPKSLRKIFSRISVIRSWANFHKQILKTINPQIGFVVSFYGPYSMSFLLACHELGIPTVDLQHGVQGNSNVAYSEWFNIPKSGYETLPNVFWVWNKEDFDEKQKWIRSNKKHLAFLGGNLLLEEFLNSDSEISKFYASKILNITNQNKKIALITLQPSNGLKNFRELIKESPKEIYYFIRLHPMMHSQYSTIERELNELKTDNWNVYDATNLPLYAILQAIDVHITEASAVVMEAEVFGVQSILIQKESEFFFLSQIKSRFAVVREKTSEIITEILHSKRRSKKLQKPMPIADKIRLLSDEIKV